MFGLGFFPEIAVRDSLHVAFCRNADDDFTSSRGIDSLFRRGMD